MTTGVLPAAYLGCTGHPHIYVVLQKRFAAFSSTLSRAAWCWSVSTGPTKGCQKLMLVLVESVSDGLVSNTQVSSLLDVIVQASSSAPVPPCTIPCWVDVQPIRSVHRFLHYGTSTGISECAILIIKGLILWVIYSTLTL